MMIDMRKYILLLCALFVGLTSCVKEDFAGADTDGLVTFKATYETETKTVLTPIVEHNTKEIGLRLKRSVSIMVR